MPKPSPIRGGRGEAEACPAYWSWNRAVQDRRWQACAACYCLARCGCGRGLVRPFLGGRCAGCGAPIRLVLPRAFREVDASPSVETAS